MRRRDGKEKERYEDMCPIHTSFDSPDSRVELELLSKARLGLSLFCSDSVRAKFCLQNNKAKIIVIIIKLHGKITCSWLLTLRL